MLEEAGDDIVGEELLEDGAGEPLLARGLDDPEPNVRQNACYSLGVVLQSAGAAAWAAYAAPALQRLAPLVAALSSTPAGTVGTAEGTAVEDVRARLLLRDNVAACVARILSVAPRGVALGGAVVAPWLALLPLQRDTAELAPVVRCLTALHRRDPADPALGALPLFHEKYTASLAALLAALSTAAPPTAPTGADESNDDPAAAAREAAPVLRAMLQQNPALAPYIQTTLPPSQQALLTQLLSTASS